MGSFISLGGVFVSSPEVVPWGPEDNSLFVLAVGTDQALWCATLNGFTGQGDGGTWSAWQSLGGVVTSPPRAVRSGESSVDVFAAGANSELLHWQFRDTAWTRFQADSPPREAMARVVAPGVGAATRNWESLGGTIVSPPHAVIFGELNDTILVFAAGTDHALWVKSAANGSWREWDTLGHTLASPPHAVTWRQETFAVFALGTDSAIWYTMGSAWHSLGGTFASAPYAIATVRHIHLFAADAQRALQHCRWDGSSWSGWESLGGILMSPPTANEVGESELLHVFGLGTDSAIWRRRWVGDSWSDWHSLRGPFLSPPATIGRAPDFPTRDLAALGADHAIWHMEEDDP